MKQPLTALLLLALSTFAAPALAETEPSSFRPKDPSLAVNAGLIQPILLHGANFEVDFRYGPLVAAYSHGFALEMEGATVVGDAKRQNVRLHIPYSTGFGIGLSHSSTSRRACASGQTSPRRSPATS